MAHSPWDTVKVEHPRPIQHDGEDVDGQCKGVEDWQCSQTVLEWYRFTQNESANGEEKGGRHKTGKNRRNEPRSDNFAHSCPFDSLRALGNQRETDRGPDDAVSAGDWQFEKSGHHEPNATASKGGQVAEHQFLRIVVNRRVNDSFTHRIRHFVTCKKEGKERN